MKSFQYLLPGTIEFLRIECLHIGDDHQSSSSSEPCDITVYMNKSENKNIFNRSLIINILENKPDHAEIHSEKAKRVMKEFRTNRIKEMFKEKEKNPILDDIYDLFSGFTNTNFYSKQA